MTTARLLGQLVLALGVVLGLMWLTARALRGASRGRGPGALDVLARRQLSRGASVAVVRVGERALVLGVTEQTVSVLGEASAAEFPAAPSARTAPPRTPPGDGNVPPAYAVGNTAGPLSGSVLSPTTWRRTMEFLRERTARRG